MERFSKHDMTISKSSIAFRDEYFAISDVLGTSKELQMERFEKDMEEYSKRSVQNFPEMESLHQVLPYRGRKDVFCLEAQGYDCILFYIHGGAWVQEMSVPQASFVDKLAQTLNAKAVIPLYPLAPQARYEESYAMLDEVYDLCVEEGKPIVLMGDSAGGSCSFGLIQRRMQADKPLPVKVIAMAPCADLSFSNPEIDEIAKIDGMLPKYSCLESAKVWTDGACVNDPSLSPLGMELAGFPDTMFIVGDHDLLYADNLLLIEKMKEAGVNVCFLNGIGFWHVFPVFELEESEACRQLIRQFVQD